MSTKKQDIHVTLDKDIFEMLESYRQKRGLNRSAAVNRLLLLGGSVSTGEPLQDVDFEKAEEVEASVS